MRSRCFKKSNIKYKNYGGRGITVCDEWKDNPKEFIDWCKVQNPSEDLTLDRIDVNGNYEPSNCRWSTLSQQGRNKTTTKIVMYNGIAYDLLTLMETYAVVKITTVRSRIKRGMDPYEACTTPLKKKVKI
jgi:hypothetical protein